MNDDLVKLLRRPYGNLTGGERQDAADRIEELEAKLTRAVKALNSIAHMKENNVVAYIQKVDAIALDALDEIGSKP